MRFSSFLLESALDILLEGADEAHLGGLHETATAHASNIASEHINKALDEGRVTVKDLQHRNHDTESGHHPVMEEAQKLAHESLKKLAKSKSKKPPKLAVEHFRHEGDKHPRVGDKSPTGVFHAYKTKVSKDQLSHVTESASHAAVAHLHEAAKHEMKEGSRYGKTFWTSNPDKEDKEGDLEKLNKHVGKQQKDVDNPSDIATIVHHAPKGKKKEPVSPTLHGTSLKYKTSKTKTNWKNPGMAVLNKHAGLPEGTMEKHHNDHQQRLAEAGYDLNDSQVKRHGQSKRQADNVKNKGPGWREDKRMLEKAQESKDKMTSGMAKAFAKGAAKKSKDKDKVKQDENHKKRIIDMAMPPTKTPYSIVSSKTDKPSDSKGTDHHGSTEKLQGHLDKYENFEVKHEGGVQVKTYATHKETGERHVVHVATFKTNRGYHHTPNAVNNLPALEDEDKQKNKTKG
jgi:hypothetical protein